jgi:hypothetical protein
MSEDELRTTGLEIKVRASPETSPQDVVNQIIAQLRPYLEQVFRMYQVVYRIRLIIQPVFVKTPQPPITVKAIVRRPITQEEYEEGEEEAEEEVE